MNLKDTSRKWCGKLTKNWALVEQFRDRETFMSFAISSWTIANITANGALIYNSTANTAVAVLAFGGDKTATNGTFSVIFPTADSTNAIIRIA